MESSMGLCWRFPLGIKFFLFDRTTSTRSLNLRARRRLIAFPYQSIGAMKVDFLGRGSFDPPEKEGNGMR